ncbi:DNA-directed RNA polymerase subunit omega [Desulfofalx alkaliphila]|uniref:DNA-directed RNA polymerase subunit omega n=1 Tax=Desulfofalx alkaliphila TaxID=105483 RepID=UPI0004E16BEB|nr:DNA-directed RNA polymerase subunit omega [Desulfofalx alkaliphila]
MNRISLDELLKKSDSRYSLVVAAAKRARELTVANTENEQGNKEITDKAVSIALEEIIKGKIKIVSSRKKNIS